MNITLINPRFGKAGAETNITSPCFPYGLAYIAKYLILDHHTVKIFDPYIEEHNRDQIEAYIAAMKADVVGISAMSVQYQQVKLLVGLIRKFHKNDIQIMLGGLLPTYSYETVLKNADIDVCVIGDGIYTMQKLLKSGIISKIPGIAFRKNKNKDIVFTGKCDYVKDLDLLGLPPYQLFNMKKYCRGRLWINDPSIKERYQNKQNIERVMTVLTSWGCPYHCNFCSISTENARQKSISATISEILYLRENYDIEGVHFVDELVFSSKQRGMELAGAIKKLNIVWDAQARVDSIDDELCRAVKDAGCTAIGLGIESGNDHILKAMNKTGVTREKIIRSVEAAQKTGLIVRAQLIMGYPGETEKSVWDTVSLFKELKLPGRRFALILPLPGSSLFTHYLASKRIGDENLYLNKISA